MAAVFWSDFFISTPRGANSCRGERSADGSSDEDTDGTHYVYSSTNAAAAGEKLASTLN